MFDSNIAEPEDCLRYVDEVGFCTWRHQPKIAWLPSLELETPWRGKEMTFKTWFWKDDLHIDRRLYFGMLLAPDTPVFVSLSFLPLLIAAQGDIDARTLHEKGILQANALKVYEYVERAGPTATQALPWPPGSRMLYLAILQQKFLVTKHDLTGRTRRTYGYRWELCDKDFPESFDRAAGIAVSEARRRIVDHLRSRAPDIAEERIAKLFLWQANP